ncbi:MAG: dTDP-4-dehydrorhamnose 3,5-epimerase family protein [Beijerinckiaceae bacterium]|jgi:dTDP-4-dehydrorhamnose 3,5-epimerase|nr:dTDP-4-dehydrorhamnose 3,5-epimerase family protein [Beijerinckiaceae bacterium]
MSALTVSPLPLAGLMAVDRAKRGDERGFLARLFCAETLKQAGWVKPIAAINHTYSALKGTLRGMHFQHAPHAEMKLVTCIRGEILDVALDLRANSPSFKRWHAETLSAENGRAMLIPEGFAHGFQALTDDVEILYCHSAAYAPEAEGAVNALDPAFGITWPLPVSVMSGRDKGHPMIDDSFKGIIL